MASEQKVQLLSTLRERFGVLHRLPKSQSLFQIGDDAAIIYIRYSKVHSGRTSFFGLREIDLRLLQGQNSFICLLVDDGSPPLFLPFSDFEQVFHLAQPASDGQYKAHLTPRNDALEFDVAGQGRFNVEGYIGFEILEKSLDTRRLREGRDLSHRQVQTLLAGIGNAKGYEVWVPQNDIAGLDWSLTTRFSLQSAIPEGFEDVKTILSEIDVLWIVSGRNAVDALFEVEHSTPIYSGLLRFNDVLLTEPKISRFSVVSNETRRDVFSRQAFRPTFRKSGLSELVNFLEYVNVYDWHFRVTGGRTNIASSEHGVSQSP
jgi:hypothetical protein